MNCVMATTETKLCEQAMLSIRKFNGYDLAASYKQGYEAAREQMAVVLETKVMKDCDGDDIETPYEEWLTLEETEITYIPDSIGLKEGDKVKLIIVKED